MANWALIFVAVVCAQSAHGSRYHGPTAVPHMLKSGYLADTHEVAAAKGVHLAALAKESHYGHGDDYSASYRQGGDYLSYGHDQVVRYQGPTAKPVVLKSGYLADTHEVAAAKKAHLSTVAKESRYGQGGDYLSYGHGQAVQYHGPTAKPVVLKSGYLADTHEVAVSKDAHLAALSKQSHYGHGAEHGGSYGHGGASDHSYGHGHDFRYHGPTAVPHVLKNGHVADTHEVAAAKAEHYAAVAEAKSHGGYGYAGDYGYGGDHGYGESYGHSLGGHSGSYGDAHDHPYGQGHEFRYHGPTAVPHVLKNGHVADTHEVAAAKAEHYAALAESHSHGGYGHGQVHSHGYSGHY